MTRTRTTTEVGAGGVSSYFWSLARRVCSHSGKGSGMAASGEASCIAAPTGMSSCEPGNWERPSRKPGGGHGGLRGSKSPKFKRAGRQESANRRGWNRQWIRGVVVVFGWGYPSWKKKCLNLEQVIVDVGVGGGGWGMGGGRGWEKRRLERGLKTIPSRGNMERWKETGERCDGPVSRLTSMFLPGSNRQTRVGKRRPRRGKETREEKKEEKSAVGVGIGLSEP